MVDLDTGSDLNSTCGAEKRQRGDSESSQYCALTKAQLHSRSTSSRPTSIHPPPYTRSQNTSMNASSIIASVPMTGSVSHPNGGSDFCNFFTLRVISVCCSGQDEIVFMRGELN